VRAAVGAGIDRASANHGRRFPTIVPMVQIHHRDGFNCVRSRLVLPLICCSPTRIAKFINDMAANSLCASSMERRVPFAKQQLRSKRSKAKRQRERETTMRSTIMNATTNENITPNAVAELDERALEAVTGGIIIVGGFDPMRFLTVMDTAAAFQSY
jgi:hypothetical protein